MTLHYTKAAVKAWLNEDPALDLPDDWLTLHSEVTSQREEIARLRAALEDYARAEESGWIRHVNPYGEAATCLYRAARAALAGDDKSAPEPAEPPKSGEQSLAFTLHEVERLAEVAKVFIEAGDSEPDATVTVIKYEQGAHSGPGLYVFDTEYPDEGCIFLGEKP
jgi:hypothetical protein